jgi:hypothetical protein
LPGPARAELRTMTLDTTPVAGGRPYPGDAHV